MSGISIGRACALLSAVLLIAVLSVGEAGAVTARPNVHPPLDFEINQGQADQQVKFLSRGSGYAFLLTANGAVMRLTPPHHDGAARRPDVVTMRWRGASSQPAIDGLDPLVTKSHYFIGNDPARWRTNVPHYAKVRYRGLYPGIDLVYYGSDQQRLEYDLVVGPGIDPGVISLAIDGVSAATIDQRGDLLLSTIGGVITQRRPVIYQEIDGVRRPVAGSYVIRSSRKGRHEVGFHVASYDAGRPLVIDPVLTLSTYWGGSGMDDATSVAVNINTGEMYLTGSTDSLTSIDVFPTVNPVPLVSVTGGATDAFLTKLNEAGTVVIYSTFIGGSAIDTNSITKATGVTVDGSGYAYVTGWTNSADFPVYPNDTTTNTYAYQVGYGGGASDAFVVRIHPAGTALIYATYLGGTGDDRANGIGVSGNTAYVVGTTESGDFPLQVPYQDHNGGGPALGKDVFLARLNDAGTALVFSTYFGDVGTDEGLALAVGTDGTVTLTGSTNSGNFPTFNSLLMTNPAYDGSIYGGGASDAFVAKFSADGKSLLYSTYLGGDGVDVGRAVTVNGSQQAFVTGETSSPALLGGKQFPVTTNALQPTNNGGVDVFVTQLSASGTSFGYSTYFGGSGTDVGNGIALSPEGFTYITGTTDSKGTPPDTPTGRFPLQNPVQNGLYGGGLHDAFVTRFTTTNQIDYSTFWGGTGDDAGLAIVVDIGTAHIVGSTTSDDLQTMNPIMLTTPAYDGSQNRGGSDAFLLSLEDDQASGCDMGLFRGPFHPFGRLDLGLPLVMGAAAGLWWVRRLRRARQ